MNKNGKKLRDGNGSVFRQTVFKRQPSFWEDYSGDLRMSNTNLKKSSSVSRFNDSLESPAMKQK